MKSICLLLFFGFTVFNSAIYADDNDDLANKLYRAIDNGDKSEVQSLIEKGAPLTSRIGRNGKPIDSPLHDAIWSKRMADLLQKNFDDQLEILKLLVKKANDLEVVDSDGVTPLYKAIESENPQAVKILLEAGANPNTYGENKLFNYKKSALHTAFKNTETVGEEIILLLIEHGADINKPSEDGINAQTPLHIAIFKGFKKSAEMLIEKGANEGAVDDAWHMTPLHYLAILDSSKSSKPEYSDWTDDDTLRIAQKMINHGADVNARGIVGGMYKKAVDMATSPKLKEFLRSKM